MRDRRRIESGTDWALVGLWAAFLIIVLLIGH